MAEGHDEQTEKDPFELTGEEFEAERKKLLATPTADSDQNGDTTGEAEASSSDSGDTGREEESKEEEKKEVKPFSLVEDEPEKKVEDSPVETFEIVHRGQVHKVTKEKIVELAQKGFDYDFKVGPHGKLVQLIDADRGAADLLNDYIRNKYGKPQEPEKPKLKPMAEYDSEVDWLRDNVEAIERSKPKPPPVQARPDPVNVMQAAIQTHDPTGSADIIPVLADHAMRLSIRDSRVIEEAAARGDLKPFFKFYDYVKEQVAPVKKPDPPTPPKFKLKSGGGQPPREESSKFTNAWDMPAKDFQAMLAKVKGGY